MYTEIMNSIRYPYHVESKDELFNIVKDTPENLLKGRAYNDVVNEDIKRSTDLHISQLPEWKEEDDTLYNTLKGGLNNYKDHIPNDYEYILFHSIKDTGYQIQRTEPQQYYAWHHDQSDQQCRMLTYMWYLNSIREGGYTEFCDGTVIYPETGKLLIFPATWEYVHRGYPPLLETKYVCIGWTYVHRDYEFY